MALPQTSRELLTDSAGVRALFIAVCAMRDELPHVASREVTSHDGRIEAALVAARYAEALVPPGGILTRSDLDRLGRPLRKAAGELFKAGQFAAMPTFSSPRQ